MIPAKYRWGLGSTHQLERQGSVGFAHLTIAHTAPPGVLTYRGAREDLRCDARRRRGCLRRLGADWIGVNFHPGSPRYVRPEDAAAIVAALPPLRRQSAFSLIDRRAKLPGSRIDWGSASSNCTETSRRKTCSSSDRFRSFGRFDWIGPRTGAALANTSVEPPELGRAPDAVLIDARVPGQMGGTGALVADDVLDAIPPLPRLILAGGLTPENVAVRVARVRTLDGRRGQRGGKYSRPQRSRSGRSVHPGCP